MSSNIISLNGINFDVEIIRKKNIKNIYLRLKMPNKIEIRTNNWVKDDYLFNFIEKKSSWIIKNYDNKIPNSINDDEMFYLGKIYKKDELLKENEDIEKFYKKNAIEYITPMVEIYSKLMNLYPKQLKFRKNKSRWGSCSMQNNINLNTELMKQDIRFIEYVVVHELAHIKHKNHQKEFWELVREYMPDFKERKKLSSSIL